MVYTHDILLYNVIFTYTYWYANTVKQIPFDIELEILKGRTQNIFCQYKLYIMTYLHRYNYTREFDLKGIPPGYHNYTCI